MGCLRGEMVVFAGVCFLAACLLASYAFLLFEGCYFQQPCGNLTSVGKIVLFVPVDAFFDVCRAFHVLYFRMLMCRVTVGSI